MLWRGKNYGLWIGKTARYAQPRLKGVRAMAKKEESKVKLRMMRWGKQRWGAPSLRKWNQTVRSWGKQG